MGPGRGHAGGLTQLTLGVDRDSELVAHIYDERNEAVKTLLRQVIRTAKHYKRKIGICGQAPSDYPDFAQFLAREHIDSISLNPDTVVKLTFVSKPVRDKAKTGIFFERIEQVSCSHCGSVVTLTEARPLSLIPCQQCGGKVFVSARLANFLVHGHIGEGEMGTIYRATDEALGREVAIKLIRGSYADDPEACERLRKEACALGKLNHPRVAQVYALSFSNGHPYLVMEFVTGEDFDRKVQQEGRLDERVVLRMAGDVADGLVALNREGLVHSDIKPANIVMDRDGNSKLVDFGLTGMSRYDSNHNLMGTPDYIAPELISGANDTPRSDIFSLGATLYHLLAGRPPTLGEKPMDVVKARIDKVPVTPLKEVALQVSPATCKMVMKMLEYLPEDRMQNSDILAYEVKEALRLLDAPPPVQPSDFGVEPPAMAAWDQNNASLLTEEAKANARNGMDSLYGQSVYSSDSSSSLSSSQEDKAKRPFKKRRMFFLGLLVMIGVLAIAVQFPPFDKIGRMVYYHTVIYVNALAKRQPVVNQILNWSGKKANEWKVVVATKLGKPSVEPNLLLPRLADFLDERKQTWQITNMGAQTKSGSAIQNAGTLIIQLPGVAVDKWESWRNGYDHGRYIWSKATTNYYAFSARIVSMANHDASDVTGLQIKGTDASTCPWVLFGFLGNGDLFFQVKNPDNQGVVIKSVRQPNVEQRHLMIVRRGSSFEALYSSNGSSWTPFGRCTLDLPSEHTVGFSVSLLDPNKFETVKFDGMSLKLPRADNK